MSIWSEINTEHNNRTIWLNDNLTMRERSRISRHVAIKLFCALCLYIGLMYVMEMFL